MMFKIGDRVRHTHDANGPDGTVIARIRWRHGKWYDTAPVVRWDGDYAERPVPDENLDHAEPQARDRCAACGTTGSGSGVCSQACERWMQLHAAPNVFVRADEVRVGSNPEMADMGNPRGDVYRTRRFVIAEAPCGSRWQHEAAIVDAAKADRLVERIHERLKAGGTLDGGRWRQVRPAYGSEAYVADGVEFEDMVRERMDDVHGH